MLGRVRHVRLVIHRLRLDDVEVGVRFATLVAADRGGDGSPDDLDWEVVADLLPGFDGTLGGTEVEMLCIVGADPDGHLVLGELAGHAIVVRVTDRMLVLRGDGALHGLDPATLSD